jgi:hypothetical protein
MTRRFAVNVTLRRPTFETVCDGVIPLYFSEDGYASQQIKLVSKTDFR